MKVAVACDHAGFGLKETVVKTIKELGHKVVDCGTCGCERVDFPDFAAKAAQLLVKKKADRAVLICGSGIGMCIAANKVHGVYACVCHDAYSARQGVEHDNMNALCLGALVIGKELAAVLIKEFLAARYFNRGNYKKRVDKIQALEVKF
ncbi:MAG: ribose 5-phosphate isomerase B [Elusimicrobiaceae bacterium]|nr:ribose 5-phosphate isomerase B [Elusimicrobiaceae bacterium]